MSEPIIQGWCPGAHRPMMSGDGLVVRVRPRLARLSRAQILGLCEAAVRFGNGTIDLTNRANLQLRGVDEVAHGPLMEELSKLGLLDSDPGVEVRRNILVTPFYQDGDLTARLVQVLIDRLGELPALPAKFGFAVDTGPERLLAECSADIRLERGTRGGLVLRADGGETGVAVTEDSAVDEVFALARWFAEHMSTEARRMRVVVRVCGLPERWSGERPVGCGAMPDPGAVPLGRLIGAPFGQLPARALAEVVRECGANALRVTPWRLVLLEGGGACPAPDFVTGAGDPLLATHACPGAPYCPQAEIETRDLARQLAPHIAGHLHVSGCAKGCAHPGPADITLVGRDGRIDLVKPGRVGDVPAKSGLSPETLLSMTDL